MKKVLSVAVVLIASVALASQVATTKFTKEYENKNAHAMMELMIPPKSILKQVGDKKEDMEKSKRLIEGILKDCFLGIFKAGKLKPSTQMPEGYQHSAYLSSISDRQMIKLKEKPSCIHSLFSSDTGYYYLIEECSVHDGSWVRRIDVYSKDPSKGLAAMMCVMIHSNSNKK